MIGRRCHGSMASTRTVTPNLTEADDFCAIDSYPQ
jgi:hypothetical protein